MFRSVQGRRFIAISLCLLVLPGMGVGRFGLASVAWAAAEMRAGEPGTTAGASAGATATKVLVLTPAAGPGVAPGAPERLRQQIERLLAEPSTPASVPPGLSPEHPAHARFEQGEALLASRRYDAAASSFQKGVEEALAAPAWVDFPRLLASLLALASAELRLGNEEKARAALLQLARFAPDFPLPHARFPPVVVRELERARARVEKHPRATLYVDGPAGARVTVDGAPIGVAPLSMTMPAGLHCLVLENENAERWGKTVDVRGSGVHELGSLPVVTGEQKSAVGPIISLVEFERLKTRARETGAAAILVSALEGKGEAFLRFEAALFLGGPGGFIRLPGMETNGSGDLTDAGLQLLRDATQRAFADPSSVSAGLPIDLRAGGERQEGSAGDAPRRQEILLEAMPEEASPVLPAANVAAVGASPVGAAQRRESSGVAWWVWTLGGVGLAALAAGAYYGVSQRDKPVTGSVRASW